MKIGDHAFCVDVGEGRGPLPLDLFSEAYRPLLRFRSLPEEPDQCMVYIDQRCPINDPLFLRGL
jgi:hypothetical protein